MAVLPLVGRVWENETEAPPLRSRTYRKPFRFAIRTERTTDTEVIHAATNGGLDDEHYEPFLGAITALLDAGAAEGTLKPGTDPEDVLLQLSVLWRIPPGEGSQARAARILDLVTDGLRSRPAETR
ncbi:hypothetical protein [Streptomyces sp. NPDC096934]|uniref:SbtR family transcriptional regulator n=1 Tax=Streptomyces sp. NPDC096934 TaxID=3155551 RepID=UPI00332F5C08